jgi:hypothetical protein
MHVHYYTTADRENLTRIYQAGQLEPAPDEFGRPALLWFSSAAKWEPTAGGQFFDGHRWRALRGTEVAAAVGCARFSLSADDPLLMTWEQACQHYRMSFTARRKLEQVARRMGASPGGWRAAAVAVPLEALQFSVLGVNGWESLPFGKGVSEEELRALSGDLLSGAPRHRAPRDR